MATTLESTLLDTSRLNLQQEQIKHLLTTPHENKNILPQSHPGVNVIIPFGSVDRLPTLSIALQSIADQIHTTSDYETFNIGPVNIIVALNGVSQQIGNHLMDIGREKGLNIFIVDANPQHPLEQSAAHARNQAFTWLRSERQHNPLLNLDTLALLDDDSALTPGSLFRMYKILHETTERVAVSAEVVPVNELTAETYRRSIRQTAIHSPVRTLPKLMNGGKFDMAGMVAYSSQIAGKTTELLVAANAILDKEGYGFPLLKSAEDMTFAAGLSRHGHIVFDSGAKVLDQARSTEEQILLQQLQWGRDHALLLHHLDQINVVTSGIHILTPSTDSHWIETIIASDNTSTGFIINPSEIQQTLNQLEEVLQAHNIALLPYKEILEQGIPLARNILSFVEKFPQGQTVIRSDLPRPTRRTSIDDPRQLPVAKIGRLAGNIIGMVETAQLIGDDLSDTIPSRFILGLRQTGIWD